MYQRFFYIFFYTTVALFVCGVFVSPVAAGGATITLAPQVVRLDQEQQFYVDVLLDPDGAAFNGVEGTVQFSADTLTFIRSEDGNSIVGPWIDRPQVDGDRIRFSGIMPNGFDGVIDPFDSHIRKPGTLLRLVFEGRAPGVGHITTHGMHITANDGNGTLYSIPDTEVAIPVSGETNSSVYALQDTHRPTLVASVVTDKKLYDGRATLIFTASDKESGVDRVEVQEGNHASVVATSPYLLEDQSRTSVITVRAYDISGNVTTVTINPVYTAETIGYILLSFIALIVLSIAIYVLRRKKSNHT